MRRKQRKSIPHKLEETGGVVTQTEEESKDRGARTNQKFVYDLNTLCPNSESVIMKPGAATAHDSPTQEGANVDTPTGDGAVLMAAATNADGIQITAASNADTIAKGAVRGDEQHAEVTLLATVPTGMGASSKKAKVARGANTLTDGGNVSLITPPAEACSDKRKVARVKAGKMDKSDGPPADALAEVIFEITIPGNCINTGVNKVSADLEEDNRVHSPNALTSNVFEGGSKRSRHSAPKGTSEEEWANMSRQQHNEWRTLRLKPINHEAIVENQMTAQVEGTATTEMPTVPETKKARTDDAFSAESEAGDTNETAVIPRPSNWDTLTRSQKSHWRRKNK
jgi:hypothetical protein